MPRAAILHLLLSAALLSCMDEAPPAERRSQTGEGRLDVEGGEIWYRVSGTGSGIPMILLHGGPGFSSFYLKPLEALGDERPVVRYDQLGGGKSATVTDTLLFTIAHFVEELESLRAHLGYERVHILGHSWGTILAVEYYRAHPERVVSLTLGSPALDMPAWERNARHLVTTLSDSAQRAIRVREAEGRHDAPDYQNAISEFYSRYVFFRPPQADLDSTFSTFNVDLYTYMQGPSEWAVTGTLREYDARPFLARIEVPTLYTVGEFDEANPEIVRGFAEATPGARMAVLADAAHITTWDAPEENVRVVRSFLREAEMAGGPR